MREHNPGLSEDEVLAAVAPAQAALDDAVNVQQVRHHESGPVCWVWYCSASPWHQVANGAEE